MFVTVHRSLSLAVVALLALSIGAAGSAHAQATVGPAGGVASTTAPSNSQGTPSGGTGVLSTTRVGPSGAVSQVPSMNTAPMADPSAPVARPRRSRHRNRHHARRPASQIGTQSQSGTNGSAAPSKY